MFLRPGAVLDAGWIEETTQFIQGVASSGRPRAATFRYARSPYAEARLRDRFRFLARIAGPLTDQGLLIARAHYDRLGGYSSDRPRSEANLLRQLGRASRTQLRSRIVTL
jgi:hypothetical protein